MASKEKYKYCFVPGCPSTSVATPDKLFFNVPRSNCRIQWCNAVGRDQVKQTSHLYCCQDHFDVENDVQNFMQFKMLKLMGEKCNLKLKAGVLPHKFKLQPNTDEPLPQDDSPVTAKKRKCLVLHDILQTPSSSAQSFAEVSANFQDTTDSSFQCYDRSDNISYMDITEPTPSSSSLSYAELSANLQDTSDSSFQRHRSDNVSYMNISEPSINKGWPTLEPQQCNLSSVSTSCPLCGNQRKIEKCYQNKRVQANICIKPHIRSVSTETDPWMSTETKGTSPVKELLEKMTEQQDVTMSGLDSKETFINNSMFEPTSSVSGLNSSLETVCNEVKEKHYENVALPINMYIMKKNPRLYLGVDSEMMHVLFILQKFSLLSETHIPVALRKIRLNESYEVLSDIFWRDKSSISRIVTATIPLIAKYFKKFNFWPAAEIIQSNAPNAFRPRYSKVQSIIDCFEVQIEKPSDPVHQSLTWSDYKKANTCKFLVSCTPDGSINFISKGYGGRASDVQIVEDSGYLDILPNSAVVIADRGFKHVQSLLMKKNCTLIRPPSVATDTKMTKNEVRETKLIASLRIHIERVIKRIREFVMLSPHACIHHDLLRFIDDIAIIVCAISNLQGPLIL